MINDSDIDDLLLARIEIALLESEVPTALLGRAAVNVAAQVDSVLNHRAGDAVAELLFHRLGKSPMGVAIRRHLLQDDSSVREEAARNGFSHVSLLKAEKKLRKLVTTRLVE